MIILIVLVALMAAMLAVAVVVGGPQPPTPAYVASGGHSEPETIAA